MQPDIPHDTVAVAVFCVAAVTELMVEPVWILAQVHHYVTLKVAVETSSGCRECAVCAGAS